MKRNYLLISLILITSICFSQKKTNSLIYNESNDLIFNGSNYETHLNNVVPKKKPKLNQKAFLDTLAYEDFDGGLNGWVVTDINNDGNIWEWNTVYRTGGATGTITAINSTTGSNGFLSLPADFYNSPRPVPLNEMNTYVTSPAITLTRAASSVYLELQQYMLRCCFFAPMQFLEISTDSVNWDTISRIDQSLPIGFLNQSNANIQPIRFNISSVAANQSTIYIRLRADRMALWFWMVDDITILEGPKHDLEVRTPRLSFNTQNYGISPAYTAIPYDLFTPMAMRATVVNEGWDTARNTRLNADIFRIRDLNNNVVRDHVYSGVDTVIGGDLAPYPNSEVLSDYELFSPLLNGVFQVTFEVATDSIDQNPGSEKDSIFIVTTDSLYAKDNGIFNTANGIGPVTISQGPSMGGYDGDACGTLYAFESRTQDKVIPTSIFFYVTSDPANIGINISPSIWVFNEDTNFATNAWLPEDFNNTTGKGLVQFGPIYQVTAADTNGWLELPLDTAGFAGLDSGLYMVGWEVISGSTFNRDVYFEVANDLLTAEWQPIFSSGLYHANTTPKNIIYNSETVLFQPAIRLNIPTLPVQTSVERLNDSKKQFFDLVPNPSTGELKISLAVEGQHTYNLNVRNILGQTVYTNVLAVNEVITKRLDLSHLEKGIYFVSLENETERLQKKIILQ